MAALAPKPARAFDVVLYGASGFVGVQTVVHFARHAPPGLRWALAGRNADKLEAARAAAGARASGAGIVIADAHHAPALQRLAAQARVVLSTAGPFSLHGSALVAACVEQRTHYVDITGETPWVRGLIERHHARAAADGTRIVPLCGFDSVPSDLGCWLLAQALWQAHGEPCVEVKAAFSISGGVNGGTLASMLALADSGQLRLLADPFLLNPPGSVPPDAAAQADDDAPHRDADFDAWLAPFVMAPVNTRVVRRSIALLTAAADPALHAGLRYRESMRVGRGAGAALAAAALGFGSLAATGAMRLAPVRSLARRLMPKPGEGPSERAMDAGSFRCDLVGRTAGGHVLRGRIAGRGDPGNRATTVFVCEAALALAVDGASLPGGPARGGLLTPATAFGAVLARRLRSAGMTVEPLPA